MPSDDDGDVDFPSRSVRHSANTPVSGEQGKMQKMDDNPTPLPKVKAARTDDNVNQIAGMELHHNDEDMFTEGWEEHAIFPDSEDAYTAGQGGQGHLASAPKSCISWMKEQL